MKYKVTRFESTGQGRVDETKVVEADRYERDHRTYTFFREGVPVATYENVTQVEEQE